MKVLCLSMQAAKLARYGVIEAKFRPGGFETAFWGGIRSDRFGGTGPHAKPFRGYAPPYQIAHYGIRAPAPGEPLI